MRSNTKFKWTFFLALSFLLLTTAFAQTNDEDDEDTPEVTARVARISFINGNAQIKRTGSEDSETASLNSPLVEGDEITTENDSAIDIQFDSRNILHLSKNSFLKINTLRDEGIAVSISEGTMSLRVFSFDKDKSFFEIDAPQTTISIQKAGLYRIDANGKDQSEIRITATEGGEARVYSDESDFNVRDGKSAKIFISGDRKGDRETADASQNKDEWDQFVAERDATIAALLDSAGYDKYYDRDIYGAEELNHFGEWVETDDYGWVWRPFQSSVSNYQNWTPYRYGHWSWIPPYGWTWINDEPWGWATYHYGRWVYDNNYWVWTPYPYNRPKRSWWKPAIVVISNVGDDICWYPTPYRKRYHDYNRDYRKKYVDKRTIANNPNVIYKQPDWTRRHNGKNYDRKDFDKLPPNAVVAVKKDRFGRYGNYSHSLPDQTAGQILVKNTDDKKSAKLPNFKERRQDFKKFERPEIPSSLKIGADTRQSGVELDKQLENRRNRDRRNRENPSNRQTNVNVGGTLGVPNTENNENRERRNNNQNRGNEQNQVQQNNREKIEISKPRTSETETPVINSPERSNENRQRRNSDEERNKKRSENSNENNRENRQRGNRDENKNNEQPRQSDEQKSRPQSTPRSEQREERKERRSEEPKSETRREQPRQERQEQPKREERREERRQEQPRQEQPKREERRQEEPRREQPKQEQPKQEQPKERPAPPPRTETKSDDSKRDTVKNERDN